MEQNGKHGFPMTDEEKVSILAFLKIVTDKEFLTNPMLAEQ